MKLVLGVDGGGSKTVAWIAQADATLTPDSIIGRGQAAASNVNTLGTQASQLVVMEAIQQAASEANVALNDLSAACFGLAGTGRETQRLEMQQWARELFAANAIVTTDVELLLGASGARVGLVAGTGSMALARNAQGESARCGGWGPLFGDEGGGYAIAVDALRAIAHWLDGRGPRTDLWDHARSFWDADNAADLRHALRSLPPNEIAAFAPRVFQAADSDALAAEIIAQNAESLAQLVAQVTLAVKLSEPICLMMSGGLLTNRPSYQEQVEHSIQGRGVQIESATLIADPVQQAVTIAWELANA